MDMIFSLRQLQEKCREQRKPLYMAFIDLTKIFDLVSRSGLFQVVERIGCPQNSSASSSPSTPTCKAPSSLMGRHQTLSTSAVVSSRDMCWRPPYLGYSFPSSCGKHSEHHLKDGKLFNIAWLKAKTKVRHLIIRDMLFADDAAVVAHSQEHLQALMDRFTQACQYFSLTISLSKTKTMGKGTETPPSITINNYTLEAVSTFTYLGSTITDNLSLDTELSSRIGKAASTFGKLTERVWDNGKLSVHTRVQVYRACFVSTLLYGSEAWTLICIPRAEAQG